MSDVLSITDAANECGVNPKVICELFFTRKLNRDDCQVVAGRTLMSREYVDAVLKPILRRCGKLNPLNERMTHAQ